MKRSQINRIIRDAETCMAANGIRLPPFATWSKEDFSSRNQQLDRFRAAQLGWDITDYGKERFEETGLVLFTLRNASPEERDQGTGCKYAEKIMISGKDQVCPMHFHESKTEDIIVRGDVPLAVRLYHANPNGELDQQTPVEVYCDGVARTVAAGDVVVLQSGESITLTPRIYHAFWGEGGACLVGEVSTVNDDHTDNYFVDPMGRFPNIEEDEAPYRFLVGDYAGL